MIALRRNVLLFHQAALGDFIVTWPIAMAAARLWPTSRVIYVTTGDRGALAERAIGVEWRDVEPTHTLFQPAGEPTEPIRKLLAGATTILSFVSTGDDAWAANVRRLAPEAQLVCIRPRPPVDDARHVMTFQAEQLGAVAQLQAAVGQMIRHVAASGATSARPGAAGDVLIHPGSGGAAKRWPIERFVQLAMRLRADGRSNTFILGEAERARLSPGTLADLRAAADVAEPQSALQLFERVRTARAYVGNDAGPTHLAAICGVPTLALFGGGEPIASTQWRPVGPAVQVVERSPLDDLSCDEVVPLVIAMLDRAAVGATNAAGDDED